MSLTCLALGGGVAIFGSFEFAMGTYNILHADLTCPRCGELVTAQVECHFGDRSQMASFRIGARYPWVNGKQPQNGGRPEQGSTDGEGYMECPHCGKDAFLLVQVREDVITGIEVDHSRPGMIPDVVRAGFVRLFHIIDCFLVEGKGLVFTGQPFPEAIDFTPPERSLVSFRHGDEEILRTRMLGFERFRNCWSPHKPRPIGILIEGKFAKLEIPKGTEVWVVPA